MSLFFSPDGKNIVSLCDSIQVCRVATTFSYFKCMEICKVM